MKKGNYDELRQSVNDYDWICSYNDNINLYANNFTTKLMELTGKCIPSKTVTVRPLDLPWINSNIRRLMRKRNRLFRKYKKDKSIENYDNFKRERNEVTTHLRRSKQHYIDSLANKLKSPNLTSKDYWKTLKSFIKPTQTSTIPPQYQNDIYVSDNTEKSNLLNDYFAQQTLIDDSSSTLPESTNIVGPFLNNIQFTPLEVQGVPETLELSKSTGPDNVNNRVLKELSVALSNPLCDLFKLLCLKTIFLIFGKKRMFHLSTKKMTPL